MLDTLFTQFAALDAKYKAIEAEREVMREQITKEMIEAGITKPHLTSTGTFTVAHKYTWTYSPALKKAIDSVKIKQMREQDKGIAKPKDNPYLLFNSKL